MKGVTVLIDSTKTILLPAVTKNTMVKTIAIISIKAGRLLKPVDDAIIAAKGILKNHSFSTKKYLLQKKEEKKLDGFVKSRHPSENRDPLLCKYLKFLDTCFRRYDDFIAF